VNISNKKGPVATTGPEETHFDQSTTVMPPEQVPVALPELAEQINAYHDRVVESLNSGLEHARHAGELLMEAKARCPHGEWSQWLAENFRGSGRTAQGYMRVAQSWPEIEAAKSATGVADLSYRGALKLLAAPKDSPAAEAEQERPIKRFLDLPLEERKQTCQEWWDIRASFTVMFDADHRTVGQIAEDLGVSVAEVDAILNPMPPQYDFEGEDKLARTYRQAVAETIARLLARRYESAQYVAECEGFAHVVPMLEAMHAKKEREVARLDGSWFRLMQSQELGTAAERLVNPIAIGILMEHDAREALGIAPRKYTSESFNDNLTDAIGAVEALRVAGELKELEQAAA
jgi:hypothetical protein